MKVGRNDPCPCGSGKKYKFCCYAKDSAKHEEILVEESAAAKEAAEDASEGAEAETHGRKRPMEHRNDRSRFQGEVRGGSSNFRPRVNRGSQRGT